MIVRFVWWMQISQPLWSPVTPDGELRASVCQRELGGTDLINGRGWYWGVWCGWQKAAESSPESSRYAVMGGGGKLTWAFVHRMRRGSVVMSGTSWFWRKARSWVKRPCNGQDSGGGKATNQEEQGAWSGTSASVCLPFLGWSPVIWASQRRRVMRGPMPPGL